MLWCLLLYSLLVAHTVQQHSIAWRGSGRDPGGTPDFKWQGWSIGGKNQNPQKSLDQSLTPQKSHTEFPSHKNFLKAETVTEQDWFYFIPGTAWLGILCRNYYNLQVVMNTPHKTLLKPSYPKKYLPKFFYPRKSQNWKFQIDHPCHWKLGVPPLEGGNFHFCCWH